jgi:hypothetical protein
VYSDTKQQQVRANTLQTLSVELNVLGLNLGCYQRLGLLQAVGLEQNVNVRLVKYILLCVAAANLNQANRY